MKLTMTNNPRVKLLNRIIFFLGLLLATGKVVASGFSVDVAYVGSSVQIAEQDFNPKLLQLGIGWQFTERFSVELTQASAESEDSVATVDAEIENMSSVMLRYGSPVSSEVNVYMMLGHTELDLSMAGVTVQSNETFAGTSWGFGFEERLNQNSDMRLYFNYIVHYKQDELTVDSLQLGLRYAFD